MKKENGHVLSIFSRFAFSLMLYHHMMMDKGRERVNKHNSMTMNGTREGQVPAPLVTQLKMKEKMKIFRSECRQNQNRILTIIQKEPEKVKSQLHFHPPDARGVDPVGPPNLPKDKFFQQRINELDKGIHGYYE